MAQTFKIEGLSDLENALTEMKKSTAKGVVKRVLLQAGAPLANIASAMAPIGETGNLSYSVVVSDKLTRRQQRMAVKESPVEVYVGTANKAGVQVEFGNDHQSAQPFLRPAFDIGINQVLDSIKANLGTEIEKTAARAAKRLARQAAKGA